MRPKNFLDKLAWADRTVLLAIVTGNAVFLYFNIFRCFNMLDMGGFLDASWRIYKGQKPYVDFVYYAGPVHLYMNAAFFKLFGFGKLAIWAHVVAVSSVMTSAVFVLIRQAASLRLAVIAAALTAPSFYWSVSHPWHDVSAHFWGSLAILVLAQHICSHRAKDPVGPWFWVGLLSVLALLTKTNLGAVYVLFVALILVLEFRNEKRSWAGYLAGIFTAAVIGLILIHSPQRFYEQCYLWQTSVIKQRLSGLFTFKDWLVNYYWVTFLLAAILVGLSRSFQRCRALVLLLTGITVIAIYAINTGGMIKPANNFLWGVQMCVAFLLVEQIGSKAYGKIYTVVRKALIGWALVLTVLAVQYGLQLKVWTYFQEKPEGDYVLRSEPLKGWKFYRPQGEPLDDLVDYVKANIPSEDRILNLTDMYILNALTGREGYKGVPFVFYKDTIPAPGREVEYVRANILRDPPEWIIMDVNSFMSMGKYLNLYQELLYAYRPIVQWGVYVLIKRI